MSTSTSLISQTIEMLSREKSIDASVIIAAIEEAVVKAAEKRFKSSEELHARYNPETGEVELFALKTVVEEVTEPDTQISLAEVEEMGIEGAEVTDQLEFPKEPPRELGRIAAQTAKQIIFQKIREAERRNVYDEYINRVGELVHGFVKRFEGGRIIVDLGKIEAVLPKMQQSRAESFSQGERIRVVINDVLTDAKGPQVEVSRTSPELLRRLFETEVPEIYDGTVQIKAAVREPGDRAKIAVISTERDVDPVGACVGMKGSRVQAIIRELRGERIDIIEWSEDPAVFAANGLSPARVSKVEINSFEDRKLTVTVPEDQLSLAIGKKGQNVRLAAKLVTWHIDIRSAEEAARAAAAQLEAVMAGGEATLTDIRESLALDQITAERLKDRGIETIEQLALSSVDELVDTIDVSFDQASEILDRSKRLLAQKHAREVREAHAAEEAAAAEEAHAAEEAAAAEAAATAPAESAEAATEPATEATVEAAQPEAADEATVEAAQPEAADEATVEAAQPEAADEATVEATLPEADESLEAGAEAQAEAGAATDEAAGASAAPAESASEVENQAPVEAASSDTSQPPAESASDDESDAQVDTLSSTEAQIQQLIAEPPPSSDAAQGPMPAAGLEAFAPGAAVVAESHAEWMEKAGIEPSQEPTIDEMIASFEVPPAQEAAAEGGDTETDEPKQE